MLTNIEKLCILAFVIAPVLMFGNANGFSELPQLQQSATEASTKIKTGTAPTLTPAAKTPVNGATKVITTATKQSVVTTAAVATPTHTRTTSVTTTTTLASSNAPATITNDVDAAATGASLQQQQEGEQQRQQRRKPERNNEATASRTTMAMPAKTAESAEMPTMNFGSKSRTFVAAETTAATSPATATYRGSDGGNEVKIQIKNAKEQTSKLNKIPENGNVQSEEQQKQEGHEAMEQQDESVTTTNEEQDAATTAKIIATAARANLFSENSKMKTAMHEAMETTTSLPTLLTFTRDSVHLEHKLASGLYRIKLAEIVTDEFGDGGVTLEFPFTKETSANAGNPINDKAATLSIEYPINATATATRKPDVDDRSRESLLPTNADSDKIIATAFTSNIADAKLNKVDLLYHPLKMLEDFNPIIRDSNAKLLKERTIFTRTDAVDEYRQNLMPNEVEMQQNTAGSSDINAAAAAAAAVQQSKNKSKIRPKSSTVNHAPANMTKRRDSISDFTGKLLAEQDGVITEIEQKFRMSEEAQRFVVTTEKIRTSKQENKVASTTAAPSTSTAVVDIPSPSSKPAASSYTVNRKIQRSTGAGAGAGADAGAGGVGHDFIERRVKKSFDFPFPIHRAASDVMSMPHIDFANTKFNSDTSGSPAKRAAAGVGAAGDAGGGAADSVAGSITNGEQPMAAAAAAAATHPEFSTTKFYNSKELYNEMLLHNKQKQRANNSTQTTTTTTSSSSSSSAAAAAAATNRNVDVHLRDISNSLQLISNAASRFATLQSPTKLKTLKPIKDDSSNPIIIVAATTTTTAAGGTSSLPTTTAIKRVTLIPPMSATATTATATPSTTTTSSPYTLTTSSSISKSSSKYQKELKRAKLLLKALLPLSTAATVSIQTKVATQQTDSNIATAAKTTTTLAPAVVIATGESFSSTSLSSTDKTFVASPRDAVVISDAVYSTDDDAPSPSPSPSVSTSTPPISTYRTSARTFATTSTATSNLSQHHRTTNPTKSTSKPIVRPRILSRLQEKINSLECEIRNVPQDSHLWRGNETHELLLPIATPENCKNDDAVEDCLPLLVSWEGEAEIQSGDILIVEINDALLNPNDKNNTNSAHTTQVYQVTRSGHEHCDVTEGILLDITPLVVDGRKLVTLYDKDLTEGVNLLIVVSELWGTQCVRLKVTTKTDNCGENAECSGKGVCYSNAIMEEYECQCCSGFAGIHCEEIDACNPSPCTNNGICVDLSQGHEGNSYQCLCPYGYTGKNCQYESDPCNSAECMNGGSCVGNSTHFRCDCSPGYAGPLCQHSLNECESSPCVHGICVDQEDGFRCFCQPGFAGELCNFEYNECESNPCQNDGECIDHIGSYECHCSKGYTGNRCQIKVDFCANKPCPEGHRCIDHGNEFSCECPGGRNGPDCNQMPRTQCNVNPCTHGGTCWSSGDSFYCACRPGYTGTMCEDEFVVETVVSSSEFIVDDTSARNFNDKTFGSSVVLKSAIELHNAYFAAGVLAAAIFIVAIVVTICHCKVNQTYRKFSTRSSTFFPILGFGRRHKSQNKLNKHWLSGKGLAGGGSNGSGNALRPSSSTASLTRSGHHHHLPTSNGTSVQGGGGGGGQQHERPFQRHLAMNLENDMYYTVDFSENSQHSPLIQ